MKKMFYWLSKCFLIFSVSLNCAAADAPAPGKICPDGKFFWGAKFIGGFEGLTESAKKLTAEKIDFNCHDADGRTLLSRMSLLSPVKVFLLTDAMDYVLKNGGDPLAKDANGKTIFESNPSMNPAPKTLLEAAVALVGQHGSMEKAIAAKVADENKSRRLQTEKTSLFRKHLQPGDDTNFGTVIEVKPNMVKVQTNESQCSQRDYTGTCLNWINTSAEKWFKRSEIYKK